MINRKKLNCKSFNILFTCIGRRVSLLNNFRKAAKELKINATFWGTDCDKLSPAFQLCDKKIIVKPIKHPDYIPDLLRIVKKNRIILVVPTIDTDLEILSEHKVKFSRLGCQVLISEPQVVHICQDKRQTYRFFRKNSFEAPETMSVKTALSRKKLAWPILLKPWDGAAGKGIATVNNRRELSVLSKRIKNCVVQEFIKGTEYTCDVFVDFGGNVRCVVPRRRIEIRAGEVSKGQVVKNKLIMNKAAQLVRRLGAGPGVITVQVILTEDKKIKFIEINPRFGGGAPLAIKAGADFPKWILQQLAGKKLQIRFDGFKNNVVMLRYDAEVWL
jgi:carbamoyl-phosphate synthase large subunit